MSTLLETLVNRPAHGVHSGGNDFQRIDSPKRAIIMVTHYQRLLNYVVPDVVHVLAEGRIVKSGGAELALELEQRGYGWVEAETLARASAGAPA